MTVEVTVKDQEVKVVVSDEEAKVEESKEAGPSLLTEEMPLGSTTAS